jgi:hypothetical protein
LIAAIWPGADAKDFTHCFSASIMAAGVQLEKTTDATAQHKTNC